MEKWLAIRRGPEQKIAARKLTQDRTKGETVAWGIVVQKSIGRLDLSRGGEFKMQRNAANESAWAS